MIRAAQFTNHSLSQEHRPRVGEEVTAVLKDKAPVGPLGLDLRHATQAATSRPVAAGYFFQRAA